MFKQLEERVYKWAYDKEIFQKAKPINQIYKTLEEVQETYDAIFAQQNNWQYYKNSKGKQVLTHEEIKDGLGDILVTVLIGCKMQNLDPLDCLESALNVIEKRTGKMINGQFVKDK